MEEKEVKKLPNKNKDLIIIIVGAAVLLAATAIFLWWSGTTTKPKSEEIITTSALQKIVNESELSTSTAIYNGIAEVKNSKKKDRVDCYVAYHAEVSAGIDFGEVKIEVDNERKTITVTIPEVHITNIDVDVESLDFIFYNPKVNTSTFTATALKACEEDVENESTQQMAILDLAKQNAINAITAWVRPFVEDMDNTYMLVVK